MKVTDYAMRAAPFDSFLTGINLIGAEIGVDVGAHAEAMLAHCSIAQLHLIDIWANKERKGYCTGRLNTKGYMHRVDYIDSDSLKAANKFTDSFFDFLYFDQLHDYKSVFEDLKHWWQKLKPGGVLGYRNYAESNGELKRAIDEFVKANNLKTEIYPGEIILKKGG